MELTTRRRLEWSWGLIALPLLLLDALWLTTPLANPGTGIEADGRYYAAMAGAPGIDPSFAHQAPWCWRILEPLLVGHLPGDLLGNFQLIGFLANWASIALMFATLRRSGLRTRLSTVGVLLYAGVFWAAKFTFYSPAYTDALTQTFVVGIVYGLVTRNLGLMVALLCLGTLQKESVALLAPAVLLAIVRGGGSVRAKALLSAAAILGPAIVYLAVHRTIVPANRYSVLPLLLGNLRLLVEPRWARIWAHSMFSGLGLVPIMVLAFPSRSRRILSREPEWLLALLFGAVTLFGGVDKARLYLPMLPVLVLTAMHVSRSFIEAQPRTGAVWLAATVGLQLFIGHWFTGMGEFRDYLARMVPDHSPWEASRPYLITFVALAAVWLVATTALRRLGPRPLP